jgi:hypothetical protein
MYNKYIKDGHCEVGRGQRPNPQKEGDDDDK